MIQYKEFDASSIHEVKEIYEQHFWQAYLNDDQQLIRAFENSSYLLGAFENEKLIGFIRCVGDQEHILIVQDLIIRKEYQRQHIAQNLLKMASDRYKHVRTFVILTDEFDKVSNAFYLSQDYKPLSSKALIGYMRTI